MPTREDLHKLIDSLPEEAIEAAYKVLSHFQVWPPPLPPQIEGLRQAYEKRLKEVQADGGEFAGWGRGGGIMEWPDDQTTPLRSGSWTFDHVDGDTLVVETRRYQDGHELAIVERIRIQDGQMNYKHEVTGPRGKRDERDIVFDLS
jgi:hypothetical protein